MNQQHPTVVIPGFMKAGTTHLHAWISSQPEFYSHGSKEPNHLVTEYWNSTQAEDYFREIGAFRGQTVDASVRYLDPDFSSVFATRLADINPHARILVGYRCPVQRSVSHVLHDTRKGRISAHSPEEYSALIRPGSIYFRRSMYGRAVRPLMDYFPPCQIAVISLEADDYAKWSVISRHLNIPDRAVPEIARMNRSSELQSYSPLMRLVNDAGVRRLPKYTPRWIRSLSRRALLREPVKPPEFSAVRAVLSSDVLDELDHEAKEFAQLTQECPWAGR